MIKAIIVPAGKVQFVLRDTNFTNEILLVKIPKDPDFSMNDYDKPENCITTDIRLAIVRTNMLLVEKIRQIKMEGNIAVAECAAKQIREYMYGIKADELRRQNAIAISSNFIIFSPYHLETLGFSPDDMAVSSEYYKPIYDHCFKDGILVPLTKPYETAPQGSNSVKKNTLVESFDMAAQKVMAGSAIEQMLTDNSVICTFTREAEGEAIRRLVGLAKERGRDLKDLVTSLENIMKGPA